jgi:NADP-dependent 3-hydroxy acid dehydrogenase YdfG
MTQRPAIVTGASSGIGLAVARMLAEEGHAVTLAARRPEKLRAAYDALRADGLEVQQVAANVADEDDVKRVVAAHRDA